MFATIALVVVMAAIVWVLKEAGVMFGLGALFAIVIYQIGYRAKHGEWFNLGG